MYHLRESIWKAAKQVHLSSFSLPEFSSRTSASAQGTWKSFMCNFWRKCIIPCIYESIRCIHEQNRCGRIPLKGKFLKKKKINLTKPMSYYNDRLRQWQSVLAFLIGIGCVSNIFPGTVLLLKYTCTVKVSHTGQHFTANILMPDETVEVKMQILCKVKISLTSKCHHTNNHSIAYICTGIISGNIIFYN